MKLTVGQGDLLQALSAVSGAIASKSYMPILSACLLTAEGDTLTLQGNNREQTIEVSIPAQIEEEGQTAVVHRIFLDLVRKTTAPVRMYTKDKLFMIKSGKLQSKLHTWDVRDYPQTEGIGEETLSFVYPAQKWKRFVEKTIIAATPVRPEFYGVAIEFAEKELSFFATDGYRVALLKTENETGITEGIAYIPVPSLVCLNRLIGDSMDDMKITASKNLICFALPGRSLLSRLLANRLPDYRRILPSGDAIKLHMNREEASIALQRIALFVEEDRKYAIVRLSAKGDALNVSTQAAGVGAMQDEVTLAEQVDECHILLNAKYALAPLQAMDSESVTLCLYGHNIPALYSEEADAWRYLHLVSPVCEGSRSAG